MRLTKIVCTLGPATANREGILALYRGGMNIARINFSHGNREDHAKLVRLIQDINKKEGIAIGLLLDTKGAEIRTGDVKEPIPVKVGEEVVFSPRPLPNEKRPVIHVNYEAFSEDVRQTDRILLDNGDMSFDIVSVGKNGSVVAKSRDTGSIGSRRHVNLPGADISLPSLTESDWKDLEMGIKENMDFTALSFIRTAEEVAEVQAFLRKKKSTMRVIAKIETKQAVENIDEIIAVSDGIMVARGDLGAEIPYELIPALQDYMVEMCRQAGKPVIVATHMLESMIKNPMPTRAEVTDVAHAAMTRTDATMLSGETAMGKHPFHAIDAMARILKQTEEHLQPLDAMVPEEQCDEYAARAHGAVVMAQALQAAAIVVLTHTGDTARSVSGLRPAMPVFALTDDPSTVHALQICYGVQPLYLPFKKDPEANAIKAIEMVKKAGGFKKGEQIVLVSQTKVAGGTVSTVNIRSIA